MTYSTTIAKPQTVCFQEGENDVGMTRMDTIIQEEYTVSLFLYTFSNFKNILLPNKIIIIRDNKEAQEVFGEKHGEGEHQPGRPYQIGVQFGVLDQAALKSSSMPHIDRSLFLMFYICIES
jgi:hypothetical protein